VKENQSLKPKIGFKIGKKQKRKTIVRSDLIIATCICGAQFLVIPDIDAMNRAIKIHITTHRCDEQYLTRQILRKAANNQLAEAATL
jgi:hypothetical protein